MQKWVVICWALLALAGADECPDGGSCEDGQTCCNDPAHGYECCPFDQAECCGDHMHCCPGGTICDTATSSCVNATASFPWVERASADQPRLSKSFRMIKAYMGEEDDNICPDQSRCPPEFSCLRALTRFGCCPLAQGVPCSDGKHCCPEGHQCSSDSRSCIKTEFVTTVLCSDEVSECPGETTCCETPEGEWGCCPMPKAVCCDDKTHCCPEGTTCDVEHNKCISSSTKKEMPMWAKLPARMRAEWENQKEGEQVTAETPKDGGSEKVPEVTPVNPVPHSENETAAGNDVPCDETTACQDGTTCCKTQEGGWACCPLPEAVCCDDFIHCCPKGKKCNLAAQTCDDNTLSVPWAEKLPAKLRQGANVGNVTCDSSYSCSDGFTCCKTQEGDWACCPLPQAVCCDDHEHCCPSGTTCDRTSLSCLGGSGSTPMRRKQPAFATAAPTTAAPSAQSNDVPCDETTACQDGTTCCKTQEGGWACCPLPEAVCCDDFIHCCPKGKKCNLAAQTCDDNTLSVPWAEKVPAKLRQGANVGNVTCDSSYSCSDGFTCCKTKEGDWACCPLPQAVCCDDHEHCCPSGTTCDRTSLSCLGGSGSTPMRRKQPAFATAAPTTAAPSAQSTVEATTRQNGDPRVKTSCHSATSGNDVPCDETTACQDGTTCCKTQEGGWACCPLPEAVCCDDFIHCCPKGKKCNLAAQTCDDNTLSVPWAEKVPAKLRQGANVGNVTCDSSYSCSDGFTCCKNKEGDWACCPLPQPEATTQQTGEEEKEPEEDEVMEEEEENKEVKGWIQCDAHTSCPQHTTCCFMALSQKWGCCPLPKAVCCADGNHCCPTHYKCNAQGTSCVRGEVVIPWYTKLPATTSVQADPSSVQCDGLRRCPEHTTCCRLSTGGWGCCPLQNAVCCPDKEHCCPQGYTCDLASDSCSKLIMLQLETVPLTPVYLPEHQPRLGPLKHRDVQCDEQSRCRDGETCCRMSAATWGCCPIPNAVCCSDMVHCCPTGYTCAAGGDCTQNTGPHWHNWHVFLANKKRALTV